MTATSTILIVDDEAASRRLLEGLLRADGYRLVFAASGPEAIALAGAHIPDLVLLDVMMPEMDGFEVCLRLRADALLAEVPIIMVTALDDRASIVRGLEAGADDFVAKPIDRVELRARVRSIMRLNRYRRLLDERSQRLQAEDELRHYTSDLETIVAQRTHDLQFERDRTRSILEALGEAVIVADDRGIIQYVNPAAVALAGYSAAESLGNHWGMWQSERQSAEFCPQIERMVLAGHTWRGEVVNRRKDGSLFTAAQTVAPLFDPHTPGRPIGFVSVQRDITQVKEAERLKDQFVSNVSHELRTPLSVITLVSGNLDTLYDRLEDHRRRGMVRDIREQTRLLSGLIEDVLEISRIDSGSAPAERRRLNLARLVDEEADKQLPLARKNNQRLHVLGARQVAVRGSDGQLRQVIRNLLNNAIKFTPGGGQIVVECREYRQPADRAQRPTTAAHDRRLSSGRVLIRPHIGRSEDVWPGGADLPDGAWAALRVTDTGMGISAGELPHIFERFYRVKTQVNIPGTGLGLSIARELVELHDGQIAVASTPEAGSSFAVYLPLLEEDIDADHPDS
jgi:PAS domain S-box-containing protein